MIKIPTHTDWNGEGRKPVAGAMERLLKETSDVPVQPEQVQFKPSKNGIYVPYIGEFAKERTLQGKNWGDTHVELYKQGLEMPTPHETWGLIFYLRDNISQPGFREVYDDILKTTSSGWHGEWQNAFFSSENGQMYVQKVIGVDSKGELVYSKKEKLEKCLKSDGLAAIDHRAGVNLQGMCIESSTSSSYEQGKNIYFWYPRNGAVARFDALSGGAGLGCGRGPTNSYSSLGVRAIRREDAKNS